MLEPLDAFGAAGPYNRAALARLYAGKRVRVARGWIERGDRFESVTLLSPYPGCDADAPPSGHDGDHVDHVAVRASVIRGGSAIMPESDTMHV